MAEVTSRDVIVIGGGQSGLATAYYLEKEGADYLVLDNQKRAGGAWRHTWQSLRLFSPAFWSSLPGMIMPGGKNYYPTRFETIEYLRKYEEKYGLQVQRPVKVDSVRKENNHFRLTTTNNRVEYTAKAIVSATGTWTHPYLPDYPGRERFRGRQIHSAGYRSPEPFQGERVLIVGDGNSGAQILAEVSKVADTLWITQGEPHFLPDEVDGHDLFHRATNIYRNRNAHDRISNPPSLGDIVMVPPVIDARERGVLEPHPPFDRFESNGIRWADGTFEEVDSVIWCTGFKPALDHLEDLDVWSGDRVPTSGTRSAREQGLWLVGYGNWTGFASATLIGVGRSARQTAQEVVTYLEEPEE